MKKYFKIILITIFLISLAGCSSGDNFSGKINIKEEMPEYIDYIRKYEQTDTYMINDDDDIKEIVDSIKNVKVGEKIDKKIDYYSDILRLEYKDGSITLVFEGEMFFDETNNERYATKGLDNLRTVLTKATKNLGETECCAVEEETTVELFEVEMIPESKAYEIFNLRGFGNERIVYNYDENGGVVEETEIDSSSEAVHPFYTTYYISSNTGYWKIDLIGEKLSATPLSIGSEQIVDNIVIGEYGDIYRYIPEVNLYEKFSAFDRDVIIRLTETITPDFLNGFDKNTIDELISGY